MWEGDVADNTDGLGTLVIVSTIGGMSRILVHRPSGSAGRATSLTRFHARTCSVNVNVCMVFIG